MPTILSFAFIFARMSFTYLASFSNMAGAAFPGQPDRHHLLGLRDGQSGL
jgi:hypothetical protein